MRILIFGGTTESRNLSRALADAGVQVTVSVVSDYGAREQGEYPGIRVSVGAKAIPEMVRMLREMDLCIDATHPYATEVTVNIRKASEEAGVERIRLRRDDAEEVAADRLPESVAAETPRTGIRRAADREEAIAIAREEIASQQGNLLLTTGVKDLPFYAANFDRERIVARVLPSEESIRTCEEAGLDHGHIIAMQGPFSAELNAALIRGFHIAALMTKESGRSGGFREKLQACRECGIPAIVIARPREQGMGYEDALKKCLALMGLDRRIER